MDEKFIIKSNRESLEINPKSCNEPDLCSKAVQSTTRLLGSENIARIIYIDDKFDVDGQKEEYKARLLKLKNGEKYITSEKFKNIDWTGPTPRFENLISDLWETTENKSKLLYEVCAHIKDKESANLIPALEIKEYYGDLIILMTPDQWVKDRYQTLKDLDEGKKALCLFDFEFQNGNKLIEGRNGAELAKMVIEQKEYTDRIVCGIFSHKFTEEQEDEFRIKYSTDYKIEKARFYTISKFRFQFDPQISGFSEGIKNLLLNPYVEHLKFKSLEVLKESNTKARKRIEDITPKTFNQIIQKSSLKEGAWEISTLFRLYGILSKEENFNMISESSMRQEFNDSINRIRDIDKEETGYISKVPNQQLIDLRESELYLQGDIINKLHLPISNGDMFKIKGKLYILLVQPCNLAIRAKDRECGVRNKNYNNAFLIPLRMFSNEQLNHTKQEVLSPTNTSEETLCAYFAEFKVFSLDYLDLTVFNEAGKSFIDMNKPKLDNELIHFPWKKRYQFVFEKLLEIEERIKSFLHLKISINPTLEKLSDNIREHAKGLDKLEKKEKKQVLKILEPIKNERTALKKHLEILEENAYSIESFSGFSLNNVSNYNSESRIFSFEIKRVKHYKTPYSDDLLQNFMLYLSRNAFEHDFTN